MTSTPADRFAVLAEKAATFNPDTLNYACAATVDLATWVMQNRALILSALRAGDGWQDIETCPRDGTEIMLGYERTGDLPEPWPLVIIAHCDREGFWVWQNRAARSYGAQPVGWRPLPPAPASSGIGETK